MGVEWHNLPQGGSGSDAPLPGPLDASRDSDERHIWVQLDSCSSSSLYGLCVRWGSRRTPKRQVEEVRDSWVDCSRPVPCGLEALILCRSN